MWLKKGRTKPLKYNYKILQFIKVRLSRYSTERLALAARVALAEHLASVPHQTAVGCRVAASPQSCDPAETWTPAML